MQPLPNSRRDGGILFTKTANRNEAPVNSDQFIKMKEDDVAADEVFFHKYFTQKAATQPKKTKKEAAGDDEDEDEVWRAMRWLGFSYVRVTPKAPVSNSTHKKKSAAAKGTTVTGTDAFGVTRT